MRLPHKNSPQEVLILAPGVRNCSRATLQLAKLDDQLQLDKVAHSLDAVYRKCRCSGSIIRSEIKLTLLAHLTIKLVSRYTTVC
jgi:hypothetical protein